MPITFIRSVFFTPHGKGLQRSRLGFGCPKCGREFGYLKRKIKRQRQTSMPIYRTKKDNYGVEQKLLIERNVHARKYDTLFGISDPDRKPIINPPEPHVSEFSDTFVQKMEGLTKGLLVLEQILSFILQKYPKLLGRFQDFAGGMKLFVEYLNATTDGRWDRSWIEWQEIVEYASTQGYNAASRKFYAIKKDDKKYLSPNQIKEKIKVVDEFNKKSEKTVPHFIDYVKELMEVVRGDVDIRKKYLEIAKEYDGNKIQIIGQKINDITDVKTYSYNYYYIIHYDPKTYHRKKSDFKNGSIKRSSVDGKKECGPFKKENFPPGAIERIRFEKVSHLYSKILFILSFRPFTASSITSIIETETMDTIKSMLEGLRISGLVEKLNYSDNKPEISDGTGESSADSDVEGNLYYLLNTSNPDSKVMLEPYKRNCKAKEMLNITKKISEYSHKEKPPR